MRFSPFTPRGWLLCALHMCGFVSAHQTPAQAQTADEFYKGRTINVVVSYAPGGGYDIYARLFARHINKHIAGTPTVVVQNMPGAASLTATNYVYNVAPQDGSVIAAVDQNIPLFELLNGKGVRYASQKFGWLGSLASANGIVISWAETGIKSLADLQQRKVTIGTTGSNDDAYIYALTLNELVGTKFQTIQGYNGTSNINLALEKGEVEAMGRSNFYGFRSQKQDWMRDKKVNILVQIGLEKQPELADVPLLLDLAKTPQDKEVATLVSLPPSLGYTYFVGPGVPADRKAILEAAFTKMIKDPAMLQDAQQINAEVRPQSGKEIVEVIARAQKISESARKRTSTFLGWD
jgi:tripartite-type tricarboxylate transporter receptor subunit TctC